MFLSASEGHTRRPSLRSKLGATHPHPTVYSLMNVKTMIVLSEAADLSYR